MLVEDYLAGKMKVISVGGRVGIRSRLHSCRGLPGWKKDEDHSKISHSSTLVELTRIDQSLNC